MKRTDRIHRLTAGLLCLIMVLTMILSALPMTAFAYSGTLTISGVLDEAFDFVLGGVGQEYLFALNNPPEGLQTYEWSVEGTLPAGLSLIDSTKSSAYIGGTPTEVTDESVALTVSVSAMTENGDEYYGEANILIRVYIPENPFAEVEALLKVTDCTVPMKTANTEEDVYTWLSEIWLPGIDGLLAALGGDFDASDLSVVLDENFTAAIAGTADNPNGTDGSVSFSVEIGGEMVLCENLTCTVKATAYSHTHTFADTYSHDSTHHWYECTDPECDEVSEKTLHSGTDDGNCTTAVFCECGYVITPAKTHEFSGEYQHDDDSHWRVCQNPGCIIINTPEAHSGEDDNNCTTAVVCECGYVITPAKTHDFSGEYKYDEDSHWHICKNLGCTVTDTAEKHSGGTATYTDRAVCSVCGQPYGATAADTTPPRGSITVGTNTWHRFLNTITFGLFFKKTMEAEITAIDSESGVMKTEYYLSDKKLDDFGSVTWSNFEDILAFTSERGYVIYVKITDNAGNSVIINSDGIVIDKTAPILSGIENGKTYCDPVEVTVSDAYLESVKLNETEITLINGKFTVNPADGQQTVTATDMAGNITSYAITFNSHTWSEKPESIDYKTHVYVCTACGTKEQVSKHSFIGPDGAGACDDCGYALSGKIEAPLDELYVYAMKGDNNNTKDAICLPVEEHIMVNDVVFENAVVIEGCPDEYYNLVFGINKQAFFGIDTSKPKEQPYIRASTSSAIKKATAGTFLNNGAAVSPGNVSLNSGYGEWKGASGVTVEFNDAESTQYMAYSLTLTDAENSTRTFTLIVKNLGQLDYTTAPDENGYSFGISFNPAAGVALPEGTKLITKPYTPTAEDKNKIAEAILSGSQPSTVTSIDAKDYVVYKRTDYTEGSVSVWDVISLNNTNYILTEFGKATPTNVSGDYERPATYFNLDDGTYCGGEYSSINGTGYWNINKNTFETLGDQHQFNDEPETIVINGATYIIGYKIGIKTVNETNLLYTQDGKAAGSFIKDLDGEMTGFIFYDDCTPEVLKESQTASSSWQFSSGNLTYNVDTVFSFDISLSKGGTPIQLGGTLSIYPPQSVTDSLDKNVQLSWFHMADYNGEACSTGDINYKIARDDLNAKLMLEHFSPFLILAITEAEPFEVPVHTVEAGEPTEQPGGDSPQTGDNSNLLLWIALLLISGGAVTALGITGKRRRAANNK